MTNVSLGKKRYERGALGLLLGAALLLSPLSAFASTAVPTQVIPPATGKSCAPVMVSDVQSHVYDGNLDSFDITLFDSTYVAVATKVGEQTVPFNYVSRWANPDGSVRMHVDVQSMRLDRDIEIQVTFLSVHTEQEGRITCVFSVPAVVKAVSDISMPGPSTGGVSTSNPAEQPSTGGKEPTTNTPGGTGSISATSTSNPALVSAVSSLGNLCADGGASRLWTVLLVLFALFTFTLCAQNFDAGPNVRNWNIGLILAVFAGLLIFWYISAACRTNPWAPAISTMITIAGLLYTMLKKSGSDQILLLKDGKK